MTGAVPLGSKTSGALSEATERGKLSRLLSAATEPAYFRRSARIVQLGKRSVSPDGSFACSWPVRRHAGERVVREGFHYTREMRAFFLRW